jgi:folate-binding protein YgfZ
MTEAVEQLTINDSPLAEEHTRLSASMSERNGWRVPASYGNAEAEYASVREEGAGLIDLSPRGRMLVTGAEAVQFLNGLITNDMKTLAENSWMPAVFPTVQGRLHASVRVVRLEDQSGVPNFLIDTEPATHEHVRKTVERFVLAGDFKVTDITNQTAHLTIQGTKAQQVIAAVFLSEPSLAPDGAMATTWRDVSLTILRATHTGEDGFDIIVGSEQAAQIWNALIEAGAKPVGYDALEVVRIEAGIARYGVDMNETNVVTETNLDDAISYTKGCYIGQEIIARIKYRGHVAKKLSGIVTDAPISIDVGTEIKSTDDKEIGRVTSTAHSPRLNKTIALGYLKYDYLAPGTEVKLQSNQGTVSGVVTELPFVRR